MPSLSEAEFEILKSAIGTALLGGRIRYSSEKELQATMAKRLATFTDQFVPEFQLSKKDRPDFFWEEKGLVIEAKVSRGDSKTIRQVVRYTEDPRVSGVLLFRHRPVEMPSTINGKPVGCIEFWRMMI